MPPAERARAEPGRIVIEIHDDGAGIDWAQVAASAHRLGLAAETAAELTEALFHDGLSTRSEVTMSSGRGVGMAALRQIVAATGGDLELHSSPTTGTTLRFTWSRALTLRPRSSTSLTGKIPCIAS